jgi:hypothetical protein
LGWFKRGKVLENKEIRRHIIWERREGGVEVLVVKNHRLSFDIPQILIVVL